jgi:hypothetical protein
LSRKEHKGKGRILSKNMVKNKKDASMLKTRYVGSVTDPLFYADPKKKNQLRWCRTNRLRMSEDDELYRDPCYVPIMGEKVHVKFYQQDYRFRCEEAL